MPLRPPVTSAMVDIILECKPDTKVLEELGAQSLEWARSLERLLYAMEEAGADLIEIGIPFSDPPLRAW